MGFGCWRRGSQPAREPTEQCGSGQGGEPLAGEGTACALARKGPAPRLSCEGGGPSTHALRWPAAEGTPLLCATLLDTAGLSLKPETRGAALAGLDHDLVAWQAAEDRC